MLAAGLGPHRQPFENPSPKEIYVENIVQNPRSKRDGMNGFQTNLVHVIV